MSKKNGLTTQSDPQSNKTWIMKSKCRCGQCELDISWTTSPTNGTVNDMITVQPVQPNDTYTFDCYCSKCRIYHGSVFTSYVQVSKEQVQIRKQSKMKYYRHTCDEMEPLLSTPNNTGSTAVVERIFCSKCYCKLATTATTTTTTITTATVHNITDTTVTNNSSNANTLPLPNITTTTTTTKQVWYINMGCIVDQTIRADFALHWRNHRIPKQLSQRVVWYPAQPKYPTSPNGSSHDDNDDENDNEEEENDNDAEVEDGTDNDVNSNNEGTSDHDNNSNDDDNSTGSRSNSDDDDDDDDEDAEDDVHHDTSQQPRKPLRGGCACGRVQYQIQQGTIDIPNELPICYCRLCRQMSGAAFVPWIYITYNRNNFQWLLDRKHHYKKSLKILRTTSFGKRHVCSYCGVVLTILYDEEKKDYIWPTAASIYDPYSDPYNATRDLDSSICLNNRSSISNKDSSIVSNDNNHIAHPIHDGILQSVRHIYCQDNAVWYQIPNDGLPRSFNND